MKHYPFAVAAHLAIRSSNTSSSESWVTSPGTAPLDASKDPFYKFNEQNISQYELGSILNWREIYTTELSNVSKAYQLLFRSESTEGSPRGVVTTVLVPDNVNGSADVVSYQIPEDSAYLDCSPSFSILTSANSAYVDIQAALNKGYLVNVPDHEGLNSSFAAGPLAGKHTIDSLRAVKNAKSTIGIEPKKLALWGYSGGSIASGWAAEIQPWYAPDVKLAAVAVGGYVVNLADTVFQVNGTPFVGFVPVGFVGLASEYLDMWDDIHKYITDDGARQIPQVLGQCTTADIAQFYNQNVFKYFKNGDKIMKIPSFAHMLKNTTLGSFVPDTSFFIYQGISDQIAPIDSVDRVVEWYCDRKVPVTYMRINGADHITAFTYGYSRALGFITSRFAGNTTKTCKTVGPAIGTYGNSTVPRPLNLTSPTNSTQSNTTNATSSSWPQSSVPSTSPTSSSGAGGVGAGGGPKVSDSSPSSATSSPLQSGAASGTGTGSSAGSQGSVSPGNGANSFSGYATALGLFLAAHLLL